MGPVTGLRERAHGIRATLVDLERQEPARLEEHPRAREQRARRVESIWAARQGVLRRPGTYRRIEIPVFRVGQIGWVGDNRAQPLAGEGREQVALADLDRDKRPHPRNVLSR